jgi:frataxin-like iron-binding protein CyaY
MPQQTDLGQVQRIDVLDEDADAELYRLTLAQESGSKVVLRASREALRELWSHLTKILYPRAADQLTDRIATVKKQKDSFPEDVSYSVVAYAHDTDPDKIVVSGSARNGNWKAWISHATGGSLWTSLEDRLNQV